MVNGENNNYLTIYDQQRVGDFKDAELARSGFHCAALCTSSVYCWMANYNAATLECQLSEAREQNITAHLVADADWMVLVIRSGDILIFFLSITCFKVLWLVSVTSLECLLISPAVAWLLLVLNTSCFFSKLITFYHRLPVICCL